MEGIKERTLVHFSHEHTLEHAISSPSSTAAGTINFCGCNLRILPGKDHYHYYTCKTCSSFSMHRECSSMPRKTKHPGHPNHDLTLLVSHPSANYNTFKCKACGDGIADFYCGCAKCGISFHILCSALPLSLVISSNPQELKMEFSPPYDFSCDMCDRTGHKWWLYRCSFCEFDTHVSCTIKDQKALPATKESNELLQLLVQKFTTAAAAAAAETQHPGRNGQLAVPAGAADSKGNFNAKNGKIELPQKKPFAPVSLRRPAKGHYVHVDKSLIFMFLIFAYSQVLAAHLG